jgi:Kef-type K+ transport system membrane component KefB
MILVVFYSSLLILGIICSQVCHLVAAHTFLLIMTNGCLAYIMMEVGLEFMIDKTRLKSYGWDFLFAFLAAALPWIFCAIYFICFLQAKWQQALLIGVFAAPTSAGVLFAMLAAAGLGTTWLFRKAQVLAVFDDFVAILLLIPLQVVFIGLKPELFLVVFFMVALLVLAFFYLHSLKIATGQYWLIFYSVGIVAGRQLVYDLTKVDLGVLLPAFTFGAVLYNPHLLKKKDVAYDKNHQEPVKKWSFILDRFIKGLFMFLVGCSLPKIHLQNISLSVFILHVVALTLLSNLGKCFLFFCYRQEVTWKNRLALSIAMFPRGEVGAGVLLIAIGYGLSGQAVSLSVLSLALNLILTGGFIVAAIELIKGEKQTSRKF